MNFVHFLWLFLVCLRHQKSGLKFVETIELGDALEKLILVWRCLVCIRVWLLNGNYSQGVHQQVLYPFFQLNHLLNQRSPQK